MASVRPKFEGRAALVGLFPAFSLSIQPFPTKQGGNPVRLKNKIAVITGGGQAHYRAEVRLHRQHRVGRRPVPLQLGRRLLRGEGRPHHADQVAGDGMGDLREPPQGRADGPRRRGRGHAGPAIFLASEDARYTTGSVLSADGGQAVGYFLSVPGRRFSGGRID